MKAKERDTQGLLFKIRLDRLCNRNDSLYRIADVIEWSDFDETFGELYSDGIRPPGQTDPSYGRASLSQAYF